MKKFSGIVLFISLSLACLGQSVSRCGAETTKGTPCKMRVKSQGLKCHHHADNNTVNGSLVSDQGRIVYTCDALTAKGKPCKRRVKIAGAKCYSHE